MTKKTMTLSNLYTALENEKFQIPNQRMNRSRANDSGVYGDDHTFPGSHRRLSPVEPATTGDEKHLYMLSSLIKLNLQFLDQ